MRKKPTTNQAYLRGRNHGRGGGVNAGWEALCIYACAPDDIRDAYAEGVRDGKTKAEKAAGPEA